MTGEINVIGLGPGDPRYLTPEASLALENSDVIVGYSTYLRLLEGRFPGKRRIETPMHGEIDRCRECFEEALAGRRVSIVCSGDPGVYGMASPILELAEGYGDVPVRIISGITAANSGAAILGAPLANDYCVISLSDLLTPWEKIQRRLCAACEGDFVIVLYNPTSRKRRPKFLEACELMLRYRRPDTPCGCVKNIGRPEEERRVFTLGDLAAQSVDMVSTVFVGNSATKVRNGWLITPRGYHL